jgi:YceI-like domain
MTRWEFEPGHTAAEFRARHMMVTWVRGLFKDIHGVVDLDFDNPTGSSFEASFRVPPVAVRIRPPALLGRDLPEVRVATPEVDLDTSSPSRYHPTGW